MPIRNLHEISKIELKDRERGAGLADAGITFECPRPPQSTTEYDH